MIESGLTDLEKKTFAVDLIEAGEMHSAVLAEVHRHAFDRPWPASAFSDLFKQPVVCGWVAMTHNPVGVLVVRQVADEAEVLTIAVLPAHRRRRVARTLMRHGMTQLRERGADRLFLEVAADNDGALALYRGLGFTMTGRRPSYYKRSDGPVDAILMSRELQGLNID